MAQELGKPRFQIIGYRKGSRDWAVPGGGRTYHWDWDTLKVPLRRNGSPSPSGCWVGEWTS